MISQPFQTVALVCYNNNCVITQAEKESCSSFLYSYMFVNRETLVLR